MIVMMIMMLAMILWRLWKYDESIDDVIGDDDDNGEND